MTCKADTVEWIVSAFFLKFRKTLLNIRCFRLVY